MKADLSDYAGELRLSACGAATDSLNLPNPPDTGDPKAGTLRDVTFGPSVPCTRPTNPTINV